MPEVTGGASRAALIRTSTGSLILIVHGVCMIYTPVPRRTPWL